MGTIVLQLITPSTYEEFADEVNEMRRLRYRVFKERMKWNVLTHGDMEFDEFDAYDPYYLLQIGFDGHIHGCVRLLPTTGHNMLRDVFPALLGGQDAPASEAIWECSRFALDLPEASISAGGIAQATYELFAGMVEFALSRKLTEIVTVTDARMERILRRAKWPLRRIGEPQQIGNTLAVAGFLEVSTDCLIRLRKAGKLKGPVLWAPVLAPLTL
ncbi:MAG TPA: acyl-homoserine-lactone synthase [Terriglobales bacterium]|nr:acyl-homoserine-lactone synthase [Terriglobales bacterium]